MADRQSAELEAMVEKGVVRAVLDLNKDGFVVSEAGRRDIRKHLSSAAGYLGVPALLDALNRIAALDIDVPPPADDLDSARLNGWQDAAQIARAALGEVSANTDNEGER